MSSVRVFALGIAACAVAAPALAADIGQPPVYTAPSFTSYPSGFNWNGPYMGVLAGYGSGDFDTGGDAGGLLGGAYVGFNHQFGKGIYGIEMDGVFSGADGTAVGGSADINWLSTARVRAGFARDKFLFYGTGGLALAGAEIAGDDNTHFGWTIGAGVEAGLSHRLTGRIEYQYANFGDETYVTTNTGFDFHAIRVGLGLKF